MNAPRNDTWLHVEDVTVRYGNVVAVDSVSLQVARGSLICLVGPSGCGKTSLLRAVAGFETPSAGRISIAGNGVVGPGQWVEPEDRTVGMVFQQGALFPHLDVRRNVEFGLRGRPDRADRGRWALSLVGLEDLASRFPDELSGGQQQRVALARALAPDPRLVLLDEPFANLDASLRQRVRDQVRTILERAGATAVLVTHDQQEALSLADRVAVMQRGRLLQTGVPEEVYRRPARLDVARFVGEGGLLPGRVRAGRLECALGSADCRRADGEVRLFVRPEDLKLISAAAGEGAPAEVIGRRFFGHDFVDEVRLDDGTRLCVRGMGPDGGRRVGDRVRLTLRPKQYLVFAAGDDDSAPALATARAATAGQDAD